MKVLNPTVHGALDYTAAFSFLLAPSLFNFSPNATTLSYIVGVAYIAASLVTKYPLGFVKLIPFPIHGVIESMMAIGFIVAPWLFNFADDTGARNFFVVAGVGLLIVVALTDYKAADAHVANPRHA